MIVHLVLGGFGLFLPLVAAVLTNSQRRSRSALHHLDHQVGRMKHGLLSPAEKVAVQQAIKAIEAQNRLIHGRFDSGGC